MSASPEGRRLKGFRLSEVPMQVRLRAKERLIHGRDPRLPPVQTFTDMLAVGVAAERPSERVYWISEEAWRRESSRGGWR